MIGTRGRFALVVVNVGAAAALLGGPGAGAPTTASIPTVPMAPLVRTAGTADPVAQVVEITNAERAKVGCPALGVDTRLARAAQLHSEDMAANNYFSHTSPDGRSFADRVRAQGYSSPGAENIAKGYRSAADVMAGWMGSDGHRRNIQNCALRAIGVGLAPGNLWTQDFGFTAPAITTPTTPATPTTTATVTTPPPTTTTASAPAPTTTPATTVAGTTATTTPAPTTPAAEVVRITNAERAKAGCPALRVDARLTRAAQLHSEDMAANNYFSHTSRDGRTFADRIRAQGHPSPAAENIAKGQRSAASVMRAWMNSAGHRRNILNCSLRSIGVGFAPGNLWTQDFGR